MEGIQRYTITITMQRLTSPAMAMAAIFFSIALLAPINGHSEQTRAPLSLLQSVTSMADAMEASRQATEEPAYMLEEANTNVASNACFQTMMAIGCRMQSQIPIWNQFAAQFATAFGISCPAVGSAQSN